METKLTASFEENLPGPGDHGHCVLHVEVDGCLSLRHGVRLALVHTTVLHDQHSNPQLPDTGQWVEMDLRMLLYSRMRI